MTEHKMTAKEMHKEFHDLIWDGTEGTPEHINRLEALFSGFALQVATEAVEEEVESYERGFGKLAAKMHGESILKNIKKND